MLLILLRLDISVHPLEHSTNIDEGWADSERPCFHSRYGSRSNEVLKDIIKDYSNFSFLLLKNYYKLKIYKKVLNS